MLWKWNHSTYVFFGSDLKRVFTINEYQAFMQMIACKQLLLNNYDSIYFMASILL